LRDSLISRYNPSGVSAAPVTKELFLNARTCPTLGWFIRNQPDQTPPTEGELFRMEQGKEIGRLARSLFPDGRFIPSGTNEAAVNAPQAAIADPELTVAFEGTFVVGNFVAKPDILLRDGNGWWVIEVKSSLADTDQLEELIDDLTYTVMVLKRAGVKIVAAELMLISRDYRKGQPTSNLFQRLDETEAVNERLPDFDAAWDELDKTTSGKEQPTPKLISECRSCPHFEADCLGKGIEHSVFCLPRLHKNRLAALADDGIIDVSDLPEGFPLTPIQQRIVDCVDCGKPRVSPALGTAFQQLKWPVSYLDFESVMTALPLYDEMPPYFQATTQYSLHRRQRPDADLEHVEYLADPMRDCQQELAEQLIEDCGDSGSIVVYSSFEKTRINGLAARFPSLSAKLMKLTERLFDLLRVIQDGYYHPGFGGSFSIKVVLPVLVPELRYDGLAIGDGDTAVARFARAALGKCSVKELEQLRKDLLVYCRQDTLAMVRVHEALMAVCRE
jgi:predicted RecB family nuclease